MAFAPASAAVDPAGDRLQAHIDPQFVRRQLAAQAPAAGEGAPLSDTADQVSAARLGRCLTANLSTSLEADDAEIVWAEDVGAGWRGPAGTS
jgi:hypothetical protein